MALNTPSGKNFFVNGTAFIPVGAQLMGPVIPLPYVEEEGGTLFLTATGLSRGQTVQPASSIPVLSGGPGQVISAGPGIVIQTGPAIPSSPIQSGNLILIFTRPDGTTFTRTSPDVYIGEVNIPQVFNGRPFNITSNTYVVYTFGTGELNEGGLWQVALLNNGQLTNQGKFFVRGFVLS